MIETVKNIENALLHLRQNKIEDQFSGGWYLGQKSAFILRRQKAIDWLTELLEKEVTAKT